MRSATTGKSQGVGASLLRKEDGRHLRGRGQFVSDIRLPGIPTSALRDAALRLRRGGVGYYSASNFVHVDVGRVRRW